MATYSLAPEAFSDLQTIWNYISTDSPAAADRMEEEFFTAFEYLALWPGSGHMRPDLTDQSVRFWPVRSYLVVYRERHAEIQVVAILHASRDIPTILEDR